MFGLFTSRKLTPEEDAIRMNPVYNQLKFESARSGYMGAYLKQKEIMKKVNYSPEIESVPIKMSLFEETQYIHTLKFMKKGSEEEKINAPNVLMLHGFAATSMCYYRLLGSFQNEANVYATDLLGMGLSSRPSYQFSDYESTIEYFVESIEAWRVAKKIEKLTLVAHSFGGYMAMHYSMKYQDRVNALILLSPMGGTTRSAEEVAAGASKFQENFFKKQLYQIVENGWKEKKSLGEFFAMPLVPSSIMIHKYIRERLGVEKEIVESWYDYMTEMFKIPFTSEKSVYTLLRFPRMSAIISIEYILSQYFAKFPEESRQNQRFPFHVYFVYGDNDWMCSEGAKRVVDSKKEGFSFVKLEKASHQMVYDQAPGLSRMIIQVVRNLQQAQKNQFKIE